VINVEQVEWIESRRARRNLQYFKLLERLVYNMKCPYCEQEMTNKQDRLGKKRLKEATDELASMDWSKPEAISLATKLMDEINKLRCID